MVDLAPYQSIPGLTYPTALGELQYLLPDYRIMEIVHLHIVIFKVLVAFCFILLKPI